MRFMKELKHRVVVVDYPPGAHGHFMAETMHEVLYDFVTDPYQDKNYHRSSIVPRPNFLNAVLDEVEIDMCVEKFFDSELPIFWPAHWSIDWISDFPGQQVNVQHTHRGYRFLEIFVSVESWPQFYINSIFNIGTSSREQLRDEAYFLENFYKHSCEIGMYQGLFGQHAVQKLIDSPETHSFTRQDVVELLVGWLVMMTKRPSSPDKIVPRRTLLPQYGFTEVDIIHSLDMNDLYSLDSYLGTIDKILSCFDLQHKLQSKLEHITAKWNKFYNNRNVNRIFDSSVQDAELHPVELSYREFIRRLA